MLGSGIADGVVHVIQRPSGRPSPDCSGPPEPDRRPAPAPPALPTLRAVHGHRGGAGGDRYEGQVVGAIVVGTSAGILFQVMCGFDDRLNTDCTLLTIEGGLAGAALGGVTGALIGGMIPKGPKAGPP